MWHAPEHIVRTYSLDNSPIKHKWDGKTLTLTQDVEPETGIVKEIEVTLPKAEDPFEIKCDIHRWMHSFCAVLDHPFYSITEKDGVYTIDGLEPGEYEITAWHEKLPAQTAMVTVTDATPVKQDFALERPKRN